jgi:hypothetical protein
VELSGESEIYVQEPLTHSNYIRNKKNVIHELIKKEPNCSAITSEKPSSVFDIYKSVLSEEKIEKLAKEQKRLLLIEYCDSTGKILEVDFLLLNSNVPDDVTITEIEQLEKAFKNHTINFYQECPDVKYFRLVVRCRFKDLIKEETSTND